MPRGKGRIVMPPRDLYYPYPKALGIDGGSRAKVKGRAMEIEQFPEFGDYMRILDLVAWEDNHRELRFTQFYRKSGGRDDEWTYGQGAGHLSIETFQKLIQKAKTNPDYGTFEGIFDGFNFAKV